MGSLLHSLNQVNATLSSTMIKKRAQLVEEMWL